MQALLTFCPRVTSEMVQEAVKVLLTFVIQAERFSTRRERVIEVNC